MVIDNFDIIKSQLTFTSDFDRYIIHIIKRAKDDKGKLYGVNETNRLLKTFYITSLEYLNKKIPVIKDLCDSNNARAYILPQVRNNEDCLKQLLKLVVDNLSNPTQKPDHLIRTAYCGFHGSRDKKWILDLDQDNMVEYYHVQVFGGHTLRKKMWTPNAVLAFVRQQLKDCGKSDNDAYMIPTRHGCCIITSPFNLEKAYKECKMFYQGVHNEVVDYKQNINNSNLSPTYTDLPIKQDVNGWLIKDGMALLYYNNAENDVFIDTSKDNTIFSLRNMPLVRGKINNTYIFKLKSLFTEWVKDPTSPMYVSSTDITMADDSATVYTAKLCMSYHVDLDKFSIAFYMQENGKTVNMVTVVDIKLDDLNSYRHPNSMYNIL